MFQHNAFTSYYYVDFQTGIPHFLCRRGFFSIQEDTQETLGTSLIQTLPHGNYTSFKYYGRMKARLTETIENNDGGRFVDGRLARNKNRLFPWHVRLY